MHLLHSHPPCKCSKCVEMRVIAAVPYKAALLDCRLSVCPTVIVIIIFYNGWPAKMGLVPFWQLSTVFLLLSLLSAAYLLYCGE